MLTFHSDKQFLIDIKLECATRQPVATSPGLARAPDPTASPRARRTAATRRQLGDDPPAGGSGVDPSRTSRIDNHGKLIDTIADKFSVAPATIRRFMISSTFMLAADKEFPMRPTTPSTLQPVRLDQLTPATLTDILRSTSNLPGAVSDVHVEAFGVGQAADSFRLHLAFDGDRGDAPETIVAKFASQNPLSRQIGVGAGLYERELSFYRDVADQLAVRTPRLIYAKGGSDGEFALLMEDVAPAVVVDQIDGCSPERATSAMRQAAALHGSSWRRADLREFSWLSSFQPALQATIEHLPTFHQQFRATYGDLVDSSVLDVTDGLLTAVPTWHRLTLDGYSLWHHDFRPDNMLFDANNGADPLVVVDWQTVSLGPGIADVSYFLGCGLSIEDRRACERDLLAIYYNGLVEAGVSELTFDECWNSYLDHAVTALFMAVHASVRVERTERGDHMWKSWIERAATQLTDHDVLARY